MLNQIVDAYHRTALLERGAIFPDTKLMPITRPEDAAIAAPGWVGKQWQPGGTLLMAINPGGGGDAYRVNPTDERLYGLFHAFKAAPADQREEALAALSEAWIGIQKTHNIFRLIRPILEALGAGSEGLAFLNVLPFRTRGDAPAGSTVLRQAWNVATSQQVAALQPGRIIALGRKAFDALSIVGATKKFDVVYLKRAIGDSYVTPEAQTAIAALRDSR
ncbi:hypothetical protein PK98_15635 [Croceibacterium mercuriale]|uniref:Uracil-DNA glycosylase-like domain-containing protein n=1 Tax=Croceibacterium mercuriale TaxID=1572751 RepID=A0A0B2BWS9_9SPHN|nr:hypothetical protein [Croceibacterium mercuriale]KHL24113.1 hypothetical protein PK98_15635 [Croceibacterium mercuriale]